MNEEAIEMKTVSRLAGALALCALTGVAQAAPLVASDSTFERFDESRSTRNLVIGSSALVADVNVTIDFGKCDSAVMSGSQTSCASNGEEFASETFFYLISPNGTRVDLVYTYSAEADGIEQGSTKGDGTYANSSNVGGRHLVTFDDQAAAAVGPVMLDGSFRPEEPLSGFIGEQALGTWIFGVGDSVGADELGLFSVTLTINAGAVDAVPAPAPLGLLGLGLAAMLIGRRRARV